MRTVTNPVCGIGLPKQMNCASAPIILPLPPRRFSPTLWRLLSHPELQESTSRCHESGDDLIVSGRAQRPSVNQAPGTTTRRTCGRCRSRATTRPRPLVQTDYDESERQLSPNGRWLAMCRMNQGATKFTCSRSTARVARCASRRAAAPPRAGAATGRNSFTPPRPEDYSGRGARWRAHLQARDPEGALLRLTLPRSRPLRHKNRIRRDA